MRFVKGISLFFLYPMLMLVVGIWLGTELSGAVEPRTRAAGEASYLPDDGEGDEAEVVRSDGQASGMKTSEGTGAQATEPPRYARGEVTSRFLPGAGQSLVEEASAGMQRLTADTEYVLEETDLVTSSVVETTWRLPDKYVGMTREQFVDALAVYEMAPPLAELERGFVGLQVLKFAPERVVVQMNYRYVEPSESFYLAVQNDEIVALLEDQRTVYINTGIPLERVPEELQVEIMRMLWVENEEALYGFLEAFSS